jgi:hypothetical protein
MLVIPTRARHAASAFLLVGLVVAWFAPVLFVGRIFLSDNTMPAFFMPVSFWSDLLYGGFPLLADLTFANAYPVRILISQFTGLAGPAGAYNAYVCSAYAIAALGAYAYTWEVVRDRVAAVAAACAFAFCSFLQAHLGHETITHTAAWMPAVMWATHRCIERASGRDMASLALFGALAYLGSHPQITLQVGVVSVLYALFLAAQTTRPVYAVTRFTVAWLLGIALVAWQMGPTIEYAASSMRGTPPVQPTFVGALPLDQLPQVVMPWIFGSYPPTAVAPLRHFGDPLVAELVAYISPAVLMLAAIAALTPGVARVSRFWVAIGLLFFVLALGPQTLLGHVRFFTPGFNLFNMPARDILTVNFAAAALAGIGIAALRGGESRGRVLAGVALGALPTMAALFFYPVIFRKAAEAGLALPAAWRNVAVVVPLAIVALSAIAIWAAARARNHLAGLAASAVIVAIVVGCGYYGWFAPWKTMSGTAAAALDKPEAVNFLERVRGERGGRLLVADGWLGPPGVIPNTSMLFGLENMAGYGPLLSRPYAELTGLTNAGGTRTDRFEPSNRVLDVLGARWIFPSKPQAEKFIEMHGMRWSATPLARTFGGTCGGGAPVPAVDFGLGQPTSVSKVAIVTTLGCAADVPVGTEVARLVVDEITGGAKSIPLIAGVHTSEWAAECGAAGSTPAYGTARVFDSVPASGCLAHHYLAEFFTSLSAARRVRIEWSDAMKRYPRAYMKVQHVTLVDGAGSPVPIGASTAPFGDERWRPHLSGSGIVLMENLRAMPRAWLVHHVGTLASVQEEETALNSGRLRDGTVFSPEKSAVTSDPGAVAAIRLRAESASPAKPVEVLRWEPTIRVLAADLAAPGMMVVSSRYHPGWSASVDGARVPVARVNAVLQGVALPAGKHEITLTFRPPYFFALLAVSLLALLGVLVLLARKTRDRRTA